MIDRRDTTRFIGTGLLLLSALAGLGFRLIRLHLGPSDFIRNRVDSLRRFEKEITVGRGRIYDRQGTDNILALDLNLKDVIADPALIIEHDRMETVASRLAPVLEADPAQLMAELDRPDRHFERLRRFLPEDKAQEITKLQLPGIYFNEVTARHYPQNSFMCHVIGFANHEGMGSSGVEQTMNRFLRGCPGFLEGKLDGRRRELYDRRTQDIPPLEGADVYLNLDDNVQYIVEKALDGAVEKYNARGGCAIVQRIRTGEILAMASRPAYNLNEFFNASEEERLNRAIGFTYEPGSTMKIITIAAALNEKVVTPSNVIDCENGAWLHHGRLLRDYHPYGELTVADILKKSSNIGAAKMAVMLGSERLSRYLRDFGIGDAMNIDLPGEEAGILHPVNEWSDISVSRIAIGQGVAVTALQMLGAMSAIANNGVVMRPYVVKRVVDKDGVVIYEPGPQELGHPLSPETATLMRKLLSRVTEQGGTGRRAGVDGYTVAGKTGTAQKPVNGVYSSTAYVASFVGFLPAEKPELGIIVVVDEPQPFHTGGVVAAPAFGEIAAQTVRCLDIPPSGEDFTIAATRTGR